MSTPKQDSFRVMGNKALDDKFLRIGRFAYVSIAEANQNIPSAERSPGLSVFIGDQLHTYAQGIADTDLLPTGIYGMGLSGNGSYVHKAGSWLEGFAVKSSGGVLDNFAIDFGPGNVVELGRKIDPAKPWWEVFPYQFYSDVNTTFNFTGVTSPIIIRISKK